MVFPTAARVKKRATALRNMAYPWLGIRIVPGQGDNWLAFYSDAPFLSMARNDVSWRTNPRVTPVRMLLSPLLQQYRGRGKVFTPKRPSRLCLDTINLPTPLSELRGDLDKAGVSRQKLPRRFARLCPYFFIPPTPLGLSKGGKEGQRR